MEEKPIYSIPIPGPGQKSFEEKHGEQGKRISIQLTKSQHAWLINRQERGLSASEVVRRLINAAIKGETNTRPPD